MSTSSCYNFCVCVAGPYVAQSKLKFATQLKMTSNF